MKKNILIPCLFLLSTMALMSVMSPVPALKVKYPKKVNSIIQAKCYGCHSPNSKGEKSRAKLNWDELGNLDQKMQSEKFQAIVKVLDEGTMPPKMMVEKDPSKKLTPEETEKMKKWASKMEAKASK